MAGFKDEDRESSTDDDWDKSSDEEEEEKKPGLFLEILKKLKRETIIILINKNYNRFLKTYAIVNSKKFYKIYFHFCLVE